MSVALPENANLEHLKGQAKSLLKSLQSGDPAALARVEGLPSQERYRLADAQLAVAREYGFESWPKLKRHLVAYPERRTELFAHIRAGDRAGVQRLVEHDRYLIHSHDPNAFGATVLNAAVGRDDLGMIDLLLELGADPNAKSDWEPGGFRPVEYGTDSAVMHLLSKGATLTAHAAARMGFTEELRRIIDDDPGCLFERGGDGRFPLHYAKTAEIVNILLDAGAEIDSRDIDHEGTPLQTNITNRAVADRLVERGAKLDVFSAIVLGHDKELERLLDEDPGSLVRRVNEPGNPWIPQAIGRHIYFYAIGPVQPHQVATKQNNESAYRILWERSSPALRLAMAGWRSDAEAAKRCVEENSGLVAGLKPADMLLLNTAAWERNLKAVQIFLELGWDPDVLNDENMTPTACAGFHGFDDVIAAILPYKPDLTIRNVYGGTPLGATMHGSLHGWRRDGNHPRCVELLIEAGSPLPDAARGSEAVKAVLIRHGLPPG